MELHVGLWKWALTRQHMYTLHRRHEREATRKLVDNGVSTHSLSLTGRVHENYRASRDQKQLLLLLWSREREREKLCSFHLPGTTNTKEIRWPPRNETLVLHKHSSHTHTHMYKEVRKKKQLILNHVSNKHSIWLPCKLFRHCLPNHFHHSQSSQVGQSGICTEIYHVLTKSSCHKRRNTSYGDCTQM